MDSRYECTLIVGGAALTFVSESGAGRYVNTSVGEVLRTAIIGIEAERSGVVQISRDSDNIRLCHEGTAARIRSGVASVGGGSGDNGGAQGVHSARSEVYSSGVGRSTVVGGGCSTVGSSSNGGGLDVAGSEGTSESRSKFVQNEHARGGVHVINSNDYLRAEEAEKKIRNVYIPPHMKRGLNYERNKQSRDRKKASKRGRRDQFSSESSVGSGSSSFIGDQKAKEVDEGKSRAWSVVDKHTVAALQKTRAARLIEENERATVKARVDTQRMLQYEKSGSMEKEIAAKVAMLDGQLSGKYSLVGGGRARGWVETVVSSPTTSSSPSSPSPASGSLGSGSVSPNSSISVEESIRLLKKVADLEEKVKEQEQALIYQDQDASFEDYYS